MTFPYALAGGFYAPTSGSYEAESVTYFEAMTSQPDSTRKGHLNTLISGLKSDGVWSKLTALYIMAMHDNQSSRINAKTPTDTLLAATNTVDFQTDRGWAGNGTNSYFTTPYIGTAMSSSDCCMFAFVETEGTASKSILGYQSSIGMIIHGSTGKPYGRLFSITSTGGAGAVTSANDQFMALRRTGTTQSFRLETTTAESLTATNSTTGQTNSFRIFTDNLVQFSDARLHFAGFGQYLNDTECNNLRTRMRTYLTAIGQL